MKIQYIPKEEVVLHLKLGRKLALFITIDSYFESLTVEWLALEQCVDKYKTTLIKTIHQGDEIFNDVLSFDTVNQYEPEFEKLPEHFFIGSLHDSFQWITFKYKIDKFHFMKLEDLQLLYTDLVIKGAFERPDIV